MAVVLKELYKNYLYFVQNKDPRMDDYFLMGSPFQVAALMFCYVYFVKKLGPKLMKNVEPFELKTAMIVYNIIQVIINLWLGVVCVKHLNKIRPNLMCFLVNYSGDEDAQKEALLCYCYFIIKLFDFTDTVIFVLRKKYNQISFLHVYHHILISLGTYFGILYLPGGHSTIVGVVNSYVHAAMYFYYFLTCVRPEVKKSIRWKKLLTQIQMLQFAYFIVHFAIPLITGNCSYPKFWLFLGLIQNFFMFALFSDFYIRAYFKKPKKSVE